MAKRLHDLCWFMHYTSSFLHLLKCRTQFGDVACSWQLMMFIGSLVQGSGTWSNLVFTISVKLLICHIFAMVILFFSCSLDCLICLTIVTFVMLCTGCNLQVKKYPLCMKDDKSISLWIKYLCCECTETIFTLEVHNVDHVIFLLSQLHMSNIYGPIPTEGSDRTKYIMYLVQTSNPWQHAICSYIYLHYSGMYVSIHNWITPSG